MDYLGKDMRKVRKDDKDEQENKEIKSKIGFLFFSCYYFL